MGRIGMNDLISRQAAIDAFTGVVILEPAQSAQRYIDGVIERIQNLPSAQPEQRWIPCSERLPEENGSYIVTSIDYVDTFEAVFDAGEWFSIDYCDDIKNVIAWMPLPDVYKGK